MSRQDPDSAQSSGFVPPEPGGPRRPGFVTLAVVLIGLLLAGVAAIAVIASRPSASSPAGDPAAGVAAGSPAVSGGTGRSAGASAPAAAPRPHASPFTAALAGYLAGRAGTVTAAVYDLRTGQTWTFGPAEPQATASVVKVDILEALLARRPGGLSAADQALAQSMIESSDNDAATALWNTAGGAAGLRSYNLSAGLAQTTPSACLACAGFPWPGWGLTLTTPADQLLLLRQLFGGPLLSAADRRYATSLLENVEPDQRWGVGSGLPAGVRVALKDGWVPLTAPDTDWQVNSEGWIAGHGRRYLVAVLASGNPSERYGIATIDAVSARLWQAMRP